MVDPGCFPGGGVQLHRAKRQSCVWGPMEFWGKFEGRCHPEVHKIKMGGQAREDVGRRSARGRPQGSARVRRVATRLAQLLEKTSGRTHRETSLADEVPLHGIAASWRAELALERTAARVGRSCFAPSRRPGPITGLSSDTYSMLNSAAAAAAAAAAIATAAAEVAASHGAGHQVSAHSSGARSGGGGGAFTI